MDGRTHQPRNAVLHTESTKIHRKEGKEMNIEEKDFKNMISPPESCRNRNYLGRIIRPD